MTDKMKAFLEEAAKDADFTERLGKADSPEAVFALAKEKGFDLTSADLETGFPDGELSDEDLDDVAGGLNMSALLMLKPLSDLLSRLFSGRSGGASSSSGAPQRGPDKAVFLGRADELRLDDIVTRGGNGPGFTAL